MRLLFYLLLVIWGAIASWIVAHRMRQRIQKALHKDVSDIELTSLNTWMQVDKKEKQDEASKAIHPK
jgi:hypothetical protein